MAIYDLADIKLAAQRLDIEYRGRKVYRDTANLGYELSDVADCLCKLTLSNFRKTHYYPNLPPDDEYICIYKKLNSDSKNDDETVDKLYIKFCLLDGCCIVDLASFHLPTF